MVSFQPAPTHGGSSFDVGLVLASFAIAQCVVAPIVGSAADALGRKNVLVCSQIGSAIAKILLIFASSVPLFMAARLIDGAMVAGLPVAQAYAASMTSTEKRRRVFLGSSAAFGIGLLGGPALAGILSQFSIYLPIFVAAALSVVSSTMSAYTLPRDKPGASRVKEKNDNSSLKRLIFDSAELRVAYGLAILFYSVFALYTSGLALYMLAELHWHGSPFDASNVAMLFAYAGVVNLLSQFAQNRWGAPFSDRMLIFVGFLFMATGYALLWNTNRVNIMILSMTISGIGSSLARPNLSTLVSKLLPEGKQAAGLGLNLSVMSLCNVICPIVTGLLFEVHAISAWIGIMVLLPISSLICVLLRRYLSRTRVEA